VSTKTAHSIGYFGMTLQSRRVQICNKQTSQDCMDSMRQAEFTRSCARLLVPKATQTEYQELNDFISKESTTSPISDEDIDVETLEDEDEVG
jgi:hypothetical protein